MPDAAPETERASPAAMNDRAAGQKRPLSPSDLSLLAELLAGLLRTRMPLPDALRVLGRDAQNRRLRDAIAAAGDEVSRGVPFNEALRKQGGVFPPLFLYIVEQGQIANDLCAALVEIVREYRSQARFRAALWAQLVGPLSTCIAFGFFIVLLVLFNVPYIFGNLYEALHVRLPVPTQVLLALARLTHEPRFWTGFLPVCAGLLLLGGWMLRRPGIRRAAQRVLLRIPVLGSYLRALFVARFCRLLCLLLQRHVALPVALELVCDSQTFLPLGDAARQVAERVRQGTALSKAMEGLSAFPQTVELFVRSGEASGNLPESLANVAEMYEEHVELLGVRLRFAIYLSASLFIGAVVFCALLSAYLPLFKLQEALMRQ